jgi:hypothetical protein
VPYSVSEERSPAPGAQPQPSPNYYSLCKDVDVVDVYARIIGYEEVKQLRHGHPEVGETVYRNFELGCMYLILWKALQNKMLSYSCCAHSNPQNAGPGSVTGPLPFAHLLQH